MKLALIRVGLAWILAAPVLLTAAAGPDRPNTLLILADGLGYGSVGCYGGAKVNTPVLDRLAREGRRFTNAYAPGSVCSPSRYGLMHPGRSRKRPEDPRDRTAAQAGRSDEPAHRQGNSVDLGESRQAVLPLFCAERRPRSDFAIGQVYRQPTRDLRELFNLAQDPGETKSVAAENPLEVGAVKPWGLTGQKVFDEGYRHAQPTSRGRCYLVYRHDAARL